jgi:hypothetical protein
MFEGWTNGNVAFSTICTTMGSWSPTSHRRQKVKCDFDVRYEIFEKM